MCKAHWNVYVMRYINAKYYYHDYGTTGKIDFELISDIYFPLNFSFLFSFKLYRNCVLYHGLYSGLRKDGGDTLHADTVMVCSSLH